MHKNSKTFILSQTYFCTGLSEIAKNLTNYCINLFSYSSHRDKKRRAGERGVHQALHSRPCRQTHVEGGAPGLRRGPHPSRGQGAALANAHRQTPTHQRQQPRGPATR